jgi:hypothetical protein
MRPKDRGISKNDFTRDENIQNSKFKLWICFKQEAMIQKNLKQQKKNYFSFNTKNEKAAYECLQKLAKKWEKDSVISLLFDRKTQKLMDVWPKDKFDINNLEHIKKFVQTL